MILDEAIYESCDVCLFISFYKLKVQLIWNQKVRMSLFN